MSVDSCDRPRASKQGRATVPERGDDITDHPSEDAEILHRFCDRLQVVVLAASPPSSGDVMEIVGRLGVPAGPLAARF